MKLKNNPTYQPDFMQIKKELSPYHNQTVIIFGSYVKGDFIEDRSDIDVAILTFSKDRTKNIQLWKDSLGKVSPKYDLRIFELFPLYIQIDIIQNNIVLFGDHLEISEYFYPYRVKWDDMVHRIEENRFDNIKEKKICLLRQKRFLSKDLISN